MATIRDDCLRLMELYPRIFFACHMRHVRDPRTRDVLSAHQASILDHLDEQEATSMSGLARHMGVTPSTMSLAIDRLEARGYVTRRRDPDDGRRVMLLLTKRGLRIREAKSVLDPGLVRSMLRKLSPAHRAEALKGLALLARTAGETMRERPAGHWSWRKGP